MSRRDEHSGEGSPVDVTRGRASAKPDPILRKSCENILRKLGLELAPELVESVASKAEQFVEERFSVEYTDLEWQRLAARRELLLVLSGGLYKNQIRAALADRQPPQPSLAGVVVDEIRTPAPGFEHSSDERRRLDPECWDLKRLDGNDLFVHLSLLAEVARRQDEDLCSSADGGQSPESALAEQLRDLVAASSEATGPSSRDDALSDCRTGAK